MILNKLYYLFLLFIYFQLFLIIVSGSSTTLILKDVTINKLFKYDKYVYNGFCSFYFDLVLSDSTMSSSSGFSLFKPQIDNYDSTMIATPIDSNSTTILYQIYIYNYPVVKPPNEYIITGSNNIDNVTLSLKFTCNVLNVNNINLLNYTPKIIPNVFGSISSLFKLGGLLEKSTLSIQSKNSNCVNVGNENDNYYIITSNSISTIPSQVSTSFDNQIFLDFDNYYNNKSIEYISDFILYPNNQNNIQLIGTGYAPVFTFKSNSSYYLPSFTTSVNSIFTNNFIFRPISSNGKTITYMGFFDYTSFEGFFADYSFLAQYAENIAVRQFFNLKVNNLLKYNLEQTAGNINQVYDRVFIEFNSNVNNNYATIYYSFQDINNYNIIIENEFPFGYAEGSNGIGFQYSSNVLLPNVIIGYQPTLYVYMDSNIISSGFNKIIISPDILDNDNKLKFGNSRIVQLFDNIFLLSIEITYNYPIYKITFAENVYNMATRVSGNDYSGVYELVFNLFSDTTFGLKVNDNSKLFTLDNYYSLSNAPLYKPFFNQDFNMLDIKNVSFLFNTMDVTNQIASNILYFNFGDSVNIDKNTPISLLIGGPLYSTPSSKIRVDASRYDQLFPAKWNSTNNRFQVEFTLKKNSQSGYLPFALVFSFDQWVLSSNDMGDDAKLYVISDNLDLYGPIFESIVKFPSLISPTSNNTLTLDSNPNTFAEFGWVLKIKDDSGFRNGSVTVMGVNDGSKYYFQLQSAFSPNSDNTSTITIKTSTNCVTQEYIISEVLLYDILDNESRFSIKYSKDSLESSLYNPFIYYLNDSTINRINVQCPTGIYSSSNVPVITSFEVSPKVVDVGLLDGNRTITFNMTLLESVNGLKDGNSPTFYLGSTGFEKFSCSNSKITIISQYSSYYECSVVLPLGFGYPFGMLVSVYGIVNKNGYYYGLNSNQLKDLGFTSKINTTLTINQPVIIGTSKISTSGGALWVYGRSLNSTYGIKTSLNPSLSFLTIQYFQGSSAALISNVPNVETPFSIQFLSTNTMNSNEFIVTPYKTSFTPPSTESPTPTTTPSPSPTPSPSSTQQPTVAPQKCIGNPECGGANNGYCNDQGQCVCHSPWVGPSCTSKVIIVPPPKTNVTNPSTEIPINDPDDNNGGTETSNYLFKSLISIISIRELSFEYSLVKTHTFDKWIYTPIDDNSSKYFTSIQVKPLSSNGNGGGDETTTTTNVTVTLEWFKDEKVVMFANESLTMMASTMKYTIEISEYKFESNLNHLQLVMMASLESSKTNDICSTSEFGETSTTTTTTGIDNSNYIKIQIDDHSLYGRFIKRAILDSTIKSISNTLLDSTFNSISNTAYSHQKYIGITIPNYKDKAIIDPDFSVLIDSQTVSSSTTNDDLICNNSKSGLSKSQLIAIIVVCSFVFIVTLLIITLLIIRSRSHTLFLLKVKDIKMFKTK